MAANPPQIHYQPWYNLIVAWAHNGALSITPATLIDKIRSQLDPHEHGFIPPPSTNCKLQFRLQVRIHSVRCWNLAGRTIALAVDDYSVRNTSDQEQVCGLVDSGTALHVPACGYKLPSSLANLVLRNDADDKDNTLVHIIAPSGNACMTYVDVTWRFDGPIKLTTDFWFQSDMHKLIASSNKVKEYTGSINATVKETLGLLRTQVQQGYIETIINGIKKTAEVVTVAGTVSLSDEDRESLVELSEAIKNLSMDRTSEYSLVNDSGEVGESPPT